MVVVLGNGSVVMNVVFLLGWVLIVNLLCIVFVMWWYSGSLSLVLLKWWKIDGLVWI